MTRERGIQLVLGLGAVALYIALLAPVWSEWIADWWNDPNYGHGWLLAVGLLALMAWRLWKGGDVGAPSVRRRELIAWLLAGAVISTLGILAAETATCSCSWRW